MQAILSEITTLITGGIVGIAKGVGGGLKELVTSIFLETTEAGEISGLSAFGGVAIVFAGLSLAIGLSRLICNWVTSLGN